MFKVLVIAYYFPPMGLSGVQRTLKFVKYMKKYNWEPTVVTADSVGYFAHDKTLLEEIENENIRIIRTSGKDPNSLLSRYGTIKIPGELTRKLFNRLSQTLFIPDNKVSWSKRAYHTISKILDKETFDVIFVTAPPFSAFKMAVKLKKNYNIPVLADYRDLWLGSYFAFYPTPLHKYLHKKLEYKVLKTVDKVTVTNRKIKEKLINNYKFLTFDDIVIISHGYDADDFKDVKIIPKNNEKLVLTYSGVFIEYSTPKYLLKAFKKIENERPDIASNIRLNFLGLLRKENRKLIKKLKLEQYVTDFGYLSHREAIEKLLESDILWFMVGRKKNIDAILPGKLFEYFGTRKPIIASVPKGAARTATVAYEAAFITEPDDVDSIKDTILNVFELYSKNELPKPNDEYIEKHRRDFLTEQLTKQFQFLIKEDVE
jgi:glycosyltransferase involved in cell wall biosynthesis